MSIFLKMIGILSFSFICAYLLAKFGIFAYKHGAKRRYFSAYPQPPTHFLLGETSFFKKLPINIRKKHR